MMSHRIVLFLFLASLAFSSCESEWMLERTKGQYLRNFESFVERVAQESPDFQTDEQWEAVEERFVAFSETKYERFKPVLSKAERRRVRRLKSRYLTLQVKYLGRRSIEQLREAVDPESERD